MTLKVEDLDDKIDFDRIFGRSGAVHFEIGTGKAAFLLNQAKAEPDENFFGIERARRYYRYAVDRIGRWGLTNVRIIRTDAVNFLTEFVQDNSVDFFHIYFPDPWPKKRHHKRRFFCPVNLEHLIRTLKTNGQLKIATDHIGYFEQIRKLTANESNRLEEIEFVPTAGAEIGEWVGTNFERKYLKQNIKIYTLALRKI
ncbi:MAG: tRNA (guanosine(46)-N7)-methyltransferase TrmB [Planctomycetota bacterium]